MVCAKACEKDSTCAACLSCLNESANCQAHKNLYKKPSAACRCNGAKERRDKHRFC